MEGEQKSLLEKQQRPRRGGAVAGGRSESREQIDGIDIDTKHPISQLYERIGSYIK
jgi:hypothetical protein